MVPHVQADLIGENLCLRQQLVVLQRRTPRPRLRAGDRRFWILACRWVPRWRQFLLVVQPTSALGWHRRGWTASGESGPDEEREVGGPPYRGRAADSHPDDGPENLLWGHRRVQAELGRLGFTVSARTVATYMRKALRRRPVTQLAGVLDAPCQGHLGVRLLRGADGVLHDAVRLLRDAPRDSTDPAGSGDPTSYRRLGGPAGRGRLRLGSRPAAVSHP